MASGKHLLGACSAVVKGKLSSFFLPWGRRKRDPHCTDGTFVYFTSKQINTYKPWGDGWITEIRWKNVFKQTYQLVKFTLYYPNMCCECNIPRYFSFALIRTTIHSDFKNVDISASILCKTDNHFISVTALQKSTQNICHQQINQAISILFIMIH